MKPEPEADRVWSTLPDTPRKPFGSALPAEQRQEIITPSLITVRTARITRRELRKMMEDEDGR